MSQEEREKLVEFIKEHDVTYNYNAVNFKFYSDKDLLILKSRIDREIEKNISLWSKKLPDKSV